MGFFDIFRAKKQEKKPFKAFSVVKTKKGNYENFSRKILKYSTIMLIIGKRGSGKTALGMKFLELFHHAQNKKCYALGFESADVPGWVKKAETIDNIPNNSIALIDEGAVVFSSRDAMSQPNKFLGKLMAVARHKNLNLILITQNSAMIDVDVLRLADTLLLKEPSLLQSKFERKALKDMYDEIKEEFNNVEDKESLFFVMDDEFEGMLRFELSEFWNESISKSFRNLRR